MTNTAITSTPREWKLTGIAKGAGQCDCCSRNLTQRVFEVSHPTLGTASLGRRCAAKATGYAANAIERAAASAARCAEMDRRRGIVAAEFPELAAAHDRATRAYAEAIAEGYGPEAAQARGWTPAVEIFSNACTTDCWWGGRGWVAYGTYAEYINDCLARA